MAQDSQPQSWSEELEQLSRVLGRVGPDEVCCEGMTRRQCSILRTLVDKLGARLSDLAADSGITPSAMTRVLERLEAQGLVQRVRGKRSEEHTSELQSRLHLVCRLLLEKKKKQPPRPLHTPRT